MATVTTDIEVEGPEVQVPEAGGTEAQEPDVRDPQAEGPEAQDPQARSQATSPLEIP